MATTLADLRRGVQQRLQDSDGLVWTAAEVDRHLIAGYHVLAQQARVFADWTYVENLPRGFSHTARWEQAEVTFTYGPIGNYTITAEARLLTETEREGPANHTSPFEVIEGYLGDCAASEAIPATADLPAPVTEIERALWDRRLIDPMTPRDARQDPRYQTTTGDVRGYLWRDDGLRRFRKVRVPAAQAAVHVIDGSWGALREPDDLSADTVTTETAEARGFSFTASWEQPSCVVFDIGRATFTAEGDEDHVSAEPVGPANHTTLWEASLGYLVAAGATATYTVVRGIVRRIPGEHPIGYESFGLARRPYRDGTNVRIEHWRTGRPLDHSQAICELPDRYAQALRYYAQSQCLRRASAGQDLRLADYYAQRWARVLARIARRLVVLEEERVGVLGGTRLARGPRPPRPRLPYAYGAQVR